MANRVVNYLAGAQNLLGVALGGAAMGVTVATGAAGSLWPVVVAASYGIGAALGALLPKRRPDLALIAGGSDAAELLAAVDELRGRRVPGELREQVTRILDTVTEIAPRWDAVRGNPAVAADVTGTLTDYLPSTLDAYDAIPAYLRNRRDPASGETPAEDAHAQLGVLVDRMFAVRNAAFEDDLRRLQVQGDFLEQKFQRRSHLDLVEPTEPE